MNVTDSVNAMGQVPANVAVTCTATVGVNTVGRRVRDSAGLTTDATLNVTVVANAAPTLGSYAGVTRAAG